MRWRSRAVEHPDLPFIRPTSATDSAQDERAATDSGRLAPAIGAVSGPTFLDPAFHQSVWKPWGEPPVLMNAAGAHASADAATENATSMRHRARHIGWVSIVGGVMVLALALVPGLMTPRGYDATPPPVPDMPSVPVVSWTAVGTAACPGGFTKDHMIMSDDRRVFSIDLRSGQEAWSVAPTVPISDVVCLPGANVVAVKDDPAHSGPPNTTLLDGSDGGVLAVLPSTMAMQVVPLGGNIGVMSPEGTLSMVTREEPLVAIWGLEFPSVAQPSTLYSTPIDADTVQLVRWSTGGRDSEANFATFVASVKDGSVPSWFTNPGAAQSRYSIIDGIAISMDWRSRPISTAVDADGNQLWERGGVPTIGDGGFEYPIVSNGRLFFNAGSVADGTSRVFEVDPRTGSEIADVTYSGEFDSVLPLPGGGIAVAGSRDVTVLDEQFQPRATIDGDQVSALAAGRNQLFFRTALEDSITTEKVRLTAVSLDDYSTAWTLDLEPGQGIHQMGRHLVVLDAGNGTIHGLSNRP